VLPSRRSHGAEAGIAELRRIRRAGGGQRQGKTRALAIRVSERTEGAGAAHAGAASRSVKAEQRQSRGRRLPAVRYTI